MNHPVGALYLPILAVQFGPRNSRNRRLQLQQSSSLSRRLSVDFNFQQ
jgi:hypothetical protein